MSQCIVTMCVARRLAWTALRNCPRVSQLFFPITLSCVSFFRVNSKDSFLTTMHLWNHPSQKK